MNDELNTLPSPNPTILDQERLKYVTRLLSSPPGLNTALLGTLTFLVNAWETLPLHSLSGWWSALAGLAWVASMWALLRVLMTDGIAEYYQQRFGSVQSAPKRASKWSALFGLALLLAFPVVLFIGWAGYLDPVIFHLHRMISDPARQINLWPSVYWAALLCGSLRWHMSGIERQSMFFMLVGMIGFASIVSYATFHPEAKQHDLWKLLNSGGFGLSFIALGLYDHITLVLLLPKRVAEGDDE